MLPIARPPTTSIGLAAVTGAPPAVSTRRAAARGDQRVHDASYDGVYGARRLGQLHREQLAVARCTWSV